LEDTRVLRFYGDVRACAKRRHAIDRAHASLCHTRDRLLDCVRTATTSACSTRARERGETRTRSISRVGERAGR